MAAIERERCRNSDRSGQRPEHRGRVKASLVHELRRYQAQPAHDFGADRDAAQDCRPARTKPFARRQHRRHDNGPGMNRAAFERVVEVFTMRGCAVDKFGAGCGQAARQ